MGKREDLRKEINALNEQLAQSALSDEWMGAVEIAVRLGMADKWRIVACALRRLVKRGEVEMEIWKVPKTYRSYEDQAVYRVPGISRGMLPHWLMPRMPEVRVIRRRVFRCE